MTAVEGQIRIDIYLEKQDINRVNISSSRPLKVTDMFVGKTPDQVLNIIPMMFNICGFAQSRASLLAFQSCLNIKPDSHSETARDLLLITEMVREHLMRITIDWPRLFDFQYKPHNLPFVNQLANNLKTILFTDGRAFTLDSQLDIEHKSLVQQLSKLTQYLETYVYGCNLTDWLDIIDSDELRMWSTQTDTVAANVVNTTFEKQWQSIGQAKTTHLDSLDENVFLVELEKVISDEFIAQPNWSGDYCETTSLSRQHNQPLIENLSHEYGNSLLTRIVSRLVELGRLSQQLNHLFHQLEMPGLKSTDLIASNGLAMVETARGKLIHQVKLDGDHIKQYKILAPTEWNFHPKGIINTIILNLPKDDRDEFEKLSHILVNTIDPCVGYEIRIID